MKKLGLLIMPLMAVSLLASCDQSKQVVQHFVTFESNGGSHIETQKVNDKEIATEPSPAPTKTDYTFGGWYSNEDLSGNTYDFSKSVTSDITLFAKWTGGPQPVIPTYTIDFQGENCTSTLDVSKQYHTNDKVEFTINLPNDSYKLPEKINVSGVSTFDYNNQTGAVSFTVENKDIGVIVKAEVIEPTTQHTVTFVLNGATSDPIEPVKVNDGSPYPSDKIPANPTNPGHTFEGWSKDEKTKDIVDLTKAPTINSDLILYAWWSDAQSVDITFDANGGYFDTTTTTTKVVPTTYGQVPVAPTPKKEVSTFIGWDKTLEPAKPEAEGGTSTYSAVWEDVTNKCHVTFDGNGGTITKDGEPRDVDYGGTIATSPTVTRDGYDPAVVEWYDAATGGNKFTFGTSTVTTNMTLYAHWGDIKTYTVVFNANGGTYSETSSDIVTRIDVKYNTMPTIPSAPTKVDSTGIKTYTFTGYDKSVVPVTGGAATITYKAQWKETTNVYTLSVTATDEGAFPDSETTKSITLAAGSNILNSISYLADPIFNDLNAVKVFDKYVYENGDEISPSDTVTEEGIKIKATYRKKTLEECSWDEISIISNQGKDFAASYFGPISPTSPLTKTVMVNNQPHTVRIIGYGQDVDENGQEIGITFEFANLISDTYGYSLATYWKNTATIDGSNSDYTNSSIRKALTGEGEGDLNWFEKNNKSFSTSCANKSVLDMLPSDLSGVLKTVKKTVNVNTGTAAAPTWTPTDFNDKLFLLNPKELGYLEASVEDSTTYNFYEGSFSTGPLIRAQVKGADGARTSQLSGTDLAGSFASTKNSYAGFHNGQGSFYWLRSPKVDTNIAAWGVATLGALINNHVPVNAYPVAPAFCI